MHPFVESVAAEIRRHELLDAGDHILVGISGGADSIVLTDVLLQLGYAVDAAHVNYGLRGGASEGDEQFVRAWCHERDIRLTVRSVDPAVVRSDADHSLQEAARSMRYETFARVARASGIERVALGHHRDDQAETVLLNLFRGTGPEGLAGMPVKRAIAPESDVVLVRPLLSRSRESIESYARHRGLTWREDETNTKPVYRRGAIRAEILPLIATYFGRSVRDNIVRSADLTRAYVDASLKGQLEVAFDASLKEADGSGSVDIAALRELTGVVRRRVLVEAVRRWLPGVDATFERAVEIDRLLESQVGRRQEYGGGVVWRERDRLFFEPTESRRSGPGAPTRLSLDAEASVEGGTLRADRLPDPPERLDSGSPNVVYVDARSVDFPLLVRRWRPGDRFSPLGMAHSKKISDFLTDEQVAPHVRAVVQVVESNDEIVWVVGRRISHGARVRPDAKETVRLSFRPNENSEAAPS